MEKNDIEKKFRQHCKFVEQYLRMSENERNIYSCEEHTLNESNNIGKFQPIKLPCSYEEYVSRWGGAYPLDELLKKLGH